MEKLKPVWLYGRFFIVSILVVALGIPAVLHGGNWPLILLLVFGIPFLLGELIGIKDLQDYQYAHPEIFYGLEYFAQFLAIINISLCAWAAGAYMGNDFLGIGAWIQNIFGYDALAVHQSHTLFQLNAIIGIGGLAAISATLIVGHELTHRVGQPLTYFIGRLGSAFGLFTYFSIRHPYGHHNLVCTPADPATSRRGENLYPFIWRSIIGQYKMTWALEKKRLSVQGKSPWSWENIALRGWAMEAGVILMFIYAGGLLGLLFILIIGLIPHLALEAANYIEHHGLVRVPTEPMKIYHAWNDNTMTTYWAIAGINRHSHHHADADVDFWELKAVPEEAPETFRGYGLSFLLAAIPPLWHRVMAPRLLEWDEKFASPAEKKLAQQQNLESGIPLLMEAAKNQPIRSAEPTAVSPSI